MAETTKYIGPAGEKNDPPAETKRELRNGSEYFRPHAMRRITVSILHDANVSLEVARGILGDGSLDM